MTRPNINAWDVIQFHQALQQPHIDLYITAELAETLATWDTEPPTHTHGCRLCNWKWETQGRHG